MGVSTAALVALARRLAREVGDRGVTVEIVVVAGVFESGWSSITCPPSRLSR